MVFDIFLTEESDFLHMGHTCTANSIAIEYMSPSLKNHRVGQCYSDSKCHDLGMHSGLKLVFLVARITSYFLCVNLRTLSDPFFWAHFRNF